MYDKIRMIILSSMLLVFSTVFTVQAAPVEYEFAESSRSIMRAGPHQSLLMLVQQLYPKHEKIWPQIQQEIMKRNPNAFNRYTGKIIPGQRMKLVTIKVIRKSHILNQHVIGEVHAIQGNVVAIDTRGNGRSLAEKANLYEGDRLTTEKNASLVIKMVDDAEIHLKQNSSVRLTEYKMKSGFETGSRSILDLIKGGLRTITGAIGANPLSVYRFHTGVMTIGVRGTDYVVMLCEENNCKKSSGRNDSDTRLHVVVLDGLISLQDEEGAVGELIMGQYAVATKETKVIVNNSLPVGGLLNEKELDLYNEIQPKLQDKDKDKDSELIWPWILGGALFGI